MTMVHGGLQADDVRAAVRVPFTRIIPTALSVIDTTNDSSSGAGCFAATSPLPPAARTRDKILVLQPRGRPSCARNDASRGYQRQL